VKQTSLLNHQQLISARQGLEFAQTAVKTTKLKHVSQQTKLDSSFSMGTLIKDEYDQQTIQLRKQFEIDTAPWETYVKKLSQLIEQYSGESQTSRSNKRMLDSLVSMKKSRTTSRFDL
jgi:hypothetical protein